MLYGIFFHGTPCTKTYKTRDNDKDERNKQLGDTW
jgi:hypothetical protein